MYSWFWRLLPGPFAARVALAAAAAAAVVALLMLVVFPAAEHLLPATDVAFDRGAPDGS